MSNSIISRCFEQLELDFYTMSNSTDVLTRKLFLSFSRLMSQLKHYYSDDYKLVKLSQIESDIDFIRRICMLYGELSLDS